MSKQAEVLKTLLGYWNPTIEVCGLVLDQEMVILCENRSTTPHESFEISRTDVENRLQNLTHFWHTHPSGCVNLSVDDYKAFLNFPKQKHLIIGNGRIAEYYVIDDVVYRSE